MKLIRQSPDTPGECSRVKIPKARYRESFYSVAIAFDCDLMVCTAEHGQVSFPASRVAASPASPP